MSPRPKIFINAISSITGAAGKTRLDGWLVDGKSAPVAAVDAPLPEIPAAWERHDSRNNRLLLAALAPIRAAVDAAIARHGPARVAVILGTSTSGIEEGEIAEAAKRATGAAPAHYHYLQQEFGATAGFLAEWLGVTGPCYTISTACSSSARALISGARLLRAGAVDAVIAGGADSLCRMTLNGFHALEAFSLTGCRPFAQNRDGITIGEGAALALLTRDEAPVALLGGGDSSDAYHMSAPRPDGAGAEQAMRAALADAALAPEDIGYINLHGTGTALNDSMESAAVNRVFGAATPCSSTKHLTGHTLGACGAVEAALCHALLTAGDATAGDGTYVWNSTGAAGSANDWRESALPAQVFTDAAPRDDTLAPIGLVTAPATLLRKPAILSNSFAFGGNNACLVLGRA
ncbi:MAG: beta-ketoacyl-ACP synthase [Puniceicoccales bacterium]|jgi:3-oxoacyl-[acyl-carrier-protein] synthase-1|nr:beta-ketoacyl-ACP synthase [Puniceicoccales bacterium]